MSGCRPFPFPSPSLLNFSVRARTPHHHLVMFQISEEPCSTACQQRAISESQLKALMKMMLTASSSSPSEQELRVTNLRDSRTLVSLTRRTCSSPSEHESLSQMKQLLLLVQPRPVRLKPAQEPIRLVLDRFVPPVLALEPSPTSSRVSTALPELALVPIAVPQPFVASSLLGRCHLPYR